MKRLDCLLAAFLTLCFVLPGCGPRAQSSEAARELASLAPAPIPLRFTDITQRAGIAWKHHNGESELRLMPEIMGSGVAFIDFDGDGFQDIFLVNGRDWTRAEAQKYLSRSKPAREIAGEKKRPASVKPSSASALAGTPGMAARPTKRRVGALYRNNGNGTFSDATRGSGLDIEMQGMGAAVGDYDGDGKSDLYVTAVGRNYLFRNRSQGRSQGKRARFDEVARAARVLDENWSSSAAWVDFDRDGRLDLFVCHYVDWSPDKDVNDNPDLPGKRYSGPLRYGGQACRLFRNRGGGRFQDVSQRAGIARQLAPGSSSGKALRGKALGVAVCDVNNDGWPDIVVANDQQRNFLFVNQKSGTFHETAVAAGIAYDKSGQARGGMGIDAGDIDQSGRDSIAIGNFNLQMIGLYLNSSDGAFTDIARPDNGVGRASIHMSTFGCVLADVDNDGWPDLMVNNGHVWKGVQFMLPSVHYEEPPLLLRNQSRGQFKDISGTSGPVFARRIVGRGLACADIDLDGDVDAILTENGGPPILMRNDGGSMNRSIRLELRGAQSNRSGIGARIEARAGGATLRRWVRSGSSYCSESELPLTLGLGRAQKADSIVIHWPSGVVTRLADVAAGQRILVREGAGLVRREPFVKGR